MGVDTDGIWLGYATTTFGDCIWISKMPYHLLRFSRFCPNCELFLKSEMFLICKPVFPAKKGKTAFKKPENNLINIPDGIELVLMNLSLT